MANSIEVKLPNIGDYKDVDVIEVFVRPGSVLKQDDSLITLESDKATMEVPCPEAGRVEEVYVKVGDKVSEGSSLIRLRPDLQGVSGGPGRDSAGEGSTQGPARTNPESVRETAPKAAPAPSRAENAAAAEMDTDVLVLGAGPGGYTAAFRAADLDQRVVLVERYPVLGGVCLNVGCIPSKAMLHIARVITEVEELRGHGVDFGSPRLDAAGIRGWAEAAVSKLTAGLARLAKQRKVSVLQGRGRFLDPYTLEIADAGGELRRVRFRRAIIATGSQPLRLADLPQDPRIMDSTGALALERIPERLVVIGGGIIGLEMATVYDALGSRVTVIEALDRIMAEADPDLVRPLERRIKKRYPALHVSTRVTAVEAVGEELRVRHEGPGGAGETACDALLVAVGRRPNSAGIGLEAAGVSVDERGFVTVDEQQRTNRPHIFAIGDVAGPPMLAHKASHEGKVAAEIAAGLKSGFEHRVVPSVAYTDPEVAWVGLTEAQAKAQGIAVEKGAFPWAANGRSLSMGREEGLTKLLFDPESGRILGMGAVGPHAGDLVAEAALAIEMGSVAGDIGLTIHPHPTLSETVAMAAEAFEGTLTDLYLPKGRRSG